VSTPQSQNISIPDLRSELKGEVIGPDDAGYDEARQPPGLRPGAQRVSTPTASVSEAVSQAWETPARSGSAGSPSEVESASWRGSTG